MDPNVSIIESLSRNHLLISTEHNLTATFLAQDAFNKAYTIATSGGDGVESKLPCVFRVTLPVEPLYKTAREVVRIGGRSKLGRFAFSKKWAGTSR